MTCSGHMNQNLNLMLYRLSIREKPSPNGLTKVQVLQKQTLLHHYNSGTNPVLLRIDICEHEDLDTTTKKCVAIKQHKAL